MKISRQEIEEKAELVLADLKPANFPIDLDFILRKQGFILKAFSSEEDESFSKYSGMVDKANKIIYVNQAESVYRKRFTVAHELGHFLLDHENDRDYRNVFYSSKPEELEANFFAACLLMPRNIFTKFYKIMTISELSVFFGVSPVAIGIRADEILSHDI